MSNLGRIRNLSDLRNEAAISRGTWSLSIAFDGFHSAIVDRTSCSRGLVVVVDHANSSTIPRAMDDMTSLIVFIGFRSHERYFRTVEVALILRASNHESFAPGRFDITFTMMMSLLRISLCALLVACGDAFQVVAPISRHPTFLSAVKTATKETATVQILMSDTGGGHRASANALRDAFDMLYPDQITCDIVDIYTDYGPVWPYNDYVAMYKLMAKYPITWDIFYRFGCTPFGQWLNNLLLETLCFNAFKECLNRPSGDTGKRADMVVSVHPLTQDIPLKILSELDSGTRDMSGRMTPFCTVVTDLGSAHPTWFNPK